MQGYSEIQKNKNNYYDVTIGSIICLLETMKQNDIRHKEYLDYAIKGISIYVAINHHSIKNDKIIDELKKFMERALLNYKNNS